LCFVSFPSFRSLPRDLHGIARCCCCARSGLGSRLFHFWVQIESSIVATFSFIFFLHSCGHLCGWRLVRATLRENGVGVGRFVIMKLDTSLRCAFGVSGWGAECWF
jgi:hypothetical protein